MKIIQIHLVGRLHEGNDFDLRTVNNLLAFISTVFKDLGSVIGKDILSILERSICKIPDLHESDGFNSGPDFTIYMKFKPPYEQKF